MSNEALKQIEYLVIGWYVSSRFPTFSVVSELFINILIWFNIIDV